MIARITLPIDQALSACPHCPNLKSTLNKTPNFKQLKKRREDQQKKKNEAKQRQQAARKASDLPSQKT